MKKIKTFAILSFVALLGFGVASCFNPTGPHGGGGGGNGDTSIHHNHGDSGWHHDSGWHFDSGWSHDSGWHFDSGWSHDSGWHFDTGWGGGPDSTLDSLFHGHHHRHH